jgi:transcription elongation factor GreA
MNTLEKEIEKIRYELAVTIPQELSDAMYSGDVLESSEYSEILSRQHLLSLRLSQLTKRLHSAKLPRQSIVSTGCVDVDMIVTLMCTTSNTTRRVKLIATELSDDVLTHDEVTLNSPLGKVLYNKPANSIISSITPAGKKEYRIIELKYSS